MSEPVLCLLLHFCWIVLILVIMELEHSFYCGNAVRASVLILVVKEWHWNSSGSLRVYLALFICLDPCCYGMTLEDDENEFMPIGYIY